MAQNGEVHQVAAEMVPGASPLNPDQAVQQLFDLQNRLVTALAYQSSGVARYREQGLADFDQVQRETAQAMVANRESLATAIREPHLQANAVGFLAAAMERNGFFTDPEVRGAAIHLVDATYKDIVQLAKVTSTPAATRLRAINLLSNLAVRGYSNRGPEGESARHHLHEIGNSMIDRMKTMDDLREHVDYIEYALTYADPVRVERLKKLIVHGVRASKHDMMTMQEYWADDSTDKPLIQLLVPLFNASSLEQSRSALWDITGRIMNEEAELSPATVSDMMRVWEDCCQTMQRIGQRLDGESVINNLAAIRDLERWRKGSVQRLRDDFGIRNPGRYNVDMLKRQLEGVTQPYGAGFSCLADHNGAFGKLGEQLEVLEESMDGGQIVVIEAEHEDELAERLEALVEKYGRAVLGFGGGHGSPEGLQLGNAHRVRGKMLDAAIAAKNEALELQLLRDEVPIPATDMTVATLNGRLVEAFRRLYVPHAPFAFRSCSLGRQMGDGHEPYAQAFSAATGFRVYSATEDTAAREIKAVPHSTDDWRLSVSYTKNCLAVYDNGHRIQ